MKQEQEQWMSEVLNSLKGFKPASGNPHLHTRVLAKLKNQNLRQPVQLNWVYAFAAIFTLMLLLNVYSWNNSFSQNEASTSIETELNDYELDNNYSSVY